jgi:hypothetical protein
MQRIPAVEVHRKLTGPLPFVPAHSPTHTTCASPPVCRLQISESREFTLSATSALLSLS